MVIDDKTKANKNGIRMNKCKLKVKVNECHTNQRIETHSIILIKLYSYLFSIPFYILTNTP